MKKITSFLLSVLFIVCCIPAIACNSNTYVSDEQQIFAVSSDTIDLFDSVTFYTKVGIDENTVTWSSTNKDVLKVEGGVLTALKEGTANIVATCNGVTQRQTVSVVRNEEYLPQIMVDDFSVLLGESVDFMPTLSFKGRTLENVDFSIAVSQPSIAEFTQGEILAKEIGSAQITISASWNGVNVANKTVICSVNSNTGIYTDKHSYVLYITDTVRGIEFAKTTDVVSKVYENGAVINEGDGITWTSADVDVATITDDGKITAVAVGATTIKGVYVSDNRTIKTVDIPVEVKIPILDTKINVIIDMNKAENVVESSALLNSSSESIGRIIDANDQTVYTENGVLNTQLFNTGEYRCEVYNEENTYGVVANFIAADLIVRTAADLDTISNAENRDKYIVLANDIDYKNGDYSSKGAHTDIENYFTGTFNGLGHSIKNLDMANSVSGLFKGTRGGTFKNFGMQVNLSKGNQAALFYWFRETPVIIDNVYLNVTIGGSSEIGGLYRPYDANGNPAVTGAGGICTHGLNASIKLSNTILHVRNAGDKGLNDLCGAIMAYSGYGTALFDNCYAITADFNISGTSTNSQNRFYQQMNKTPNVIYESDQAFEAARKREGSVIDLSGFNEFWSIPEFGVPSFISMG